MSQQYDDTNRGFAMLNKQKKTDKHPDWTGKLDVDGVSHRFAAWKRTTKKGEPLLSFSIERADEQGAQRDRRGPPKRQRYEDDGVDLDDEIPW